MNGDFSHWRFDAQTNADSVLHQQGRLLTDADWNQQSRLSQRWRDQAARAAFGRWVAAIPQAWEDSLQVTKATLAGDGSISVEIRPGQVWADGLLSYLRSSDGPGGVETRPIAHLEPPTPAGAGAAGTRDAVVLEVWREALSAFQVPHEYLEPALGGVDTTERAWHGLSLHLVRMTAEEDCREVAERIQDDLSKRGRLSVQLEPSVTSGGPCPVVVGGGYSGFEHHLYRIEIAQVTGGTAMFKWSQFNGGLVARATFDQTARKAKIRANRQAVLRSGLQNFYVEVYEPVPIRPPQPATPDGKESAELAEEWRLVYGGRAALASDEEIDLTEDKFGSIPGDQNRHFFLRIWNELRPLSAFQAAAASELRDGIFLRFTGGGSYRPGDYWTFPVRVGEVASTEPLIDDQPPLGVERIRVPLAVLNWAGNPEITLAAKEIEDCRKVFPPLTDLPPGCCWTVEPGQDLHAVIKKIKKVGAGCICLLPGEHRIDKPIDLTGVSNIRFEGFGLASQLIVESKEASAAAFDLTGSSSIGFHSFAILNRTQASTFLCGATRNLDISDMFVASSIFARRGATMTVRDAGSAGWRIEGNVFLSSIGIEGFRLSRSRISENTFVGSLFGIRLSDLFEVLVERNRFLGIPADVGAGFDNAFSTAPPGGSASGTGLFSTLIDAGKATLEEKLAILLEALEAAARQSASTRYHAVRVSGFLDSSFTRNRIIARTGLFAELLENGSCTWNRMLTTAGAAGFGLVRGLEFSSNRIGERRVGKGAHLSPRVGLLVLMDAIDCRITNNSFLDVNEAIVFESDLTGGREVLRDVEASLKAVPDAEEDEIASFVTDAKEDVEAHRVETRVLSSTYFSVGKCERVLIQGNHIEADSTGIEWSGTKNIVDFRVSRNAFLGCTNGAILIEPDDRIFFLAEGVDTKVRLIERNRFDIRGVAVRSTIGAVRVARNDIRVRPPVVTNLKANDFFKAVEGQVLTNAEFNAASKKRDIGNMRIYSKAAMVMAGSDPDGMDTGAFHEKAEDQFLSSRELYAGDSMADNLNLMSKLALADDAPLLILGLGAFLKPLVTSLEGFTLNLAGIQNEIVDNNLLSDSSELEGGAVLHLASGVVSGNEIQVGRFGVLVNSKVGQARDSLRVEGNKLRVTGPPKGDGKQAAAYALALPTLTPGNYAILDNAFDGSVMVGAEPFASSGLIEKEKLDIPLIVNYYHALALEDSGFAKSIINKGKPAKDASATMIDSGLLGGLLLGHLFELFLQDPHKDRAVVQFSDNRVVRGYVALARSSGGAFWTKETLENNASSAPIIEMNGNILDYWARVVGRDLILVGNHSQSPLFYRGTKVEQVANIPKAAAF